MRLCNPINRVYNSGGGRALYGNKGHVKRTKSFGKVDYKNAKGTGIFSGWYSGG